MIIIDIALHPQHHCLPSQLVKAILNVLNPKHPLRLDTILL